MADQSEHTTIEDVFNRNLDALLEARSMEYRDLLDLLEAAGYTPDSPATVLLNDAVAMAAVLGVSPIQLFRPPDKQAIDVTPAIEADRHLADLWLRGLRPLRDDDFADFHRQASPEDMDADRVAELWVRSERLRTVSLTMALNDAVDRKDVNRVKELTTLAARVLNQQTLEQADRVVPRSVRRDELEAAVTRATRFRRQTVPR